MTKAQKPKKLSKKATKSVKQRRKKGGVKAFRDHAVIAAAARGKKTTEIAAELQICRQTVSEILNSDDAVKYLKEIEDALAKGIDSAIATILVTVKTDYHAARDLLRSFGVLRAPINVNHTGVVSLERIIAGSNDVVGNKENGHG